MNMIFELIGLLLVVGCAFFTTFLKCIAFAIRSCCVILVYQLLYKRGVYEIRCSTQPKS